MSKMKCNPHSRQSIRGLAEYIRKQLRIENEKMFPIVELLDIFKDCFEDFEYEVISDDEFVSNSYAYTDVSKGVVYIRESVYNGATLGNGRDRFTIAHEIGHYTLHNKINNYLHRTDDNIKLYEDPEWQANCFAAELLVPHNLIEELSIEEIVAECAVSKQVATIQKSYKKR